MFKEKIIYFVVEWYSETTDPHTRAVATSINRVDTLSTNAQKEIIEIVRADVTF